MYPASSAMIFGSAILETSSTRRSVSTIDTESAPFGRNFRYSSFDPTAPSFSPKRVTAARR